MQEWTQKTNRDRREECKMNAMNPKSQKMNLYTGIQTETWNLT